MTDLINDIKTTAIQLLTIRCFDSGIIVKRTRTWNKEKKNHKEISPAKMSEKLVSTTVATA
jgi:hypothetical protein